MLVILKKSTLVVLRLVKDELCALGDLSKVKITKELLKSVKNLVSKVFVLFGGMSLVHP